MKTDADSRTIRAYGIFLMALSMFLAAVFWDKLGGMDCIGLGALFAAGCSLFHKTIKDY